LKTDQLNILLLHNKYLIKGGEDTVAYNEFEALKNAGYNAYFMEFSNSKFNILNPLTYIFSINSIFNFYSFFKVFIFLHQKKINILHVHNLFYTASPSVFWAAKFAGVKTIMTVHNYRLFCLSATFFKNGQPCFECHNKKSFQTGIESKCFKSSTIASFMLAITINFNKILGTWHSKIDKFIVVNLFTKELIIQTGVDQHKIYFKPNFISTPSKPLSPEVIKEDYYLYVGRLSEEKGLVHLLDGFVKMNKRLILAGEGTFISNINALNNPLIHAVGLKSKNDISELMLKCKALIFSSIWIEGMPMTIIESLSLGVIPIVAFSINTEKMIADKVDGILYDANDPEGLIKAIDYFEQMSIIEKGIMAKMCERKFNDMFTEQKHMEKLIDIYIN
jgi:glycosyltransferase involved in cell wall biosynthesis